jgi:DNA polymerase/3'-5' exonuclease PolX
MQFNYAKRLADRTIEILTPTCEIIHCAGSVRRLQPEVKDIEIVCLPKKEFVQTGLFGEGEWVRTKAFKTAIDTITDFVVKGEYTGRYMQIALKGCDGFKMDLFMPQEHDYYRQLAIRTGSAEFSKQFIADIWVKNGWVGTKDGLRKVYECEKSGDKSWICVVKNPQLPPKWESEEAFFNWLGVAYVAPELRNM